MESPSDYISLDFGIVPIPTGTKRPNRKGWQDNPITRREDAEQVWANGGNIGLHHAASGTVALDIDHPEFAALALASVGINLEALRNAPGPKIRTPKGLKPIYRASHSARLSRKAYSWRLPDGESVTLFEIRAGNTQDVLPPSVHPSGLRYTWEPEAPRTREEIPELPIVLLHLWQHWDVLKPLMDRANPSAPPPPAKAWQEGVSVIATYNERYSVREVLERNGYACHGDRYLSPHSSTGMPGVIIFKGDDGRDRCYSHHGSDLLAAPHSHDAFGVYVLLEHDGAVKAAVKAAARDLGLAPAPPYGQVAEQNTADDAGSKDTNEKKESRKSQATELAELVMASGAELFHSADDEPFITLPVRNHFETYRLKSRGAKSWMRWYYRDHMGKSIGGQAFQDALNDLEGEALFAGTVHPVFVRLAEHKGDIVVDLGDDTHQVVRITPVGWHLEAYSQVKFVRPKALASLPIPAQGGSLSAFWDLLNVREEDRVLVAAWQVAALRPTGPYPILALHGEQGSAKSTTARAVRALVDPSSAPLRSEPRTPQDLMIAATSSWVPTFDNLSSISPALSDALCILSTGAASSFLSSGVNVRGRSSILRLNYRTTEQIPRHADSLLLDPLRVTTLTRKCDTPSCC